MKELLKELGACTEAYKWAGDKSIEEIVETCHRGDWLLWLASKIGVGIKPLTLAKGHCANTVRHLMKDERSINAVDVAIRFGEGKACRDELDNAAYAAAAYAPAYAAYAAAYAAYAYAAAANAADDADAYASVKRKNKMQTADICRKYIGELIIEKVNERI